MSQKLYPAQRNTVTPKWNLAENIRRSVVEPFGAELQGLRFDSQQLQDALKQRVPLQFRSPRRSLYGP